MSTLYTYDFITLPGSAILQNADFPVDVHSSIYTCYSPVRHLYLPYCSSSARSFCYTLSDNEGVGSTSPYDDDGD